MSGGGQQQPSNFVGGYPGTARPSQCGGTPQQQQQQQQNFGGPHPASCGSPALQSFSPSVRQGTSPTHSAYGGSSPGTSGTVPGLGRPGTPGRPQPSRSPASGASPRLQQGPPPPYGARGALASPHPPPSPSPRPSGGLPSPADSTRSFPHPAGRLANPSPGGGGGSVQTTPLSSPKPCGGPNSVGRAPATPTTPGGSAVPSPSSGGGKKRAATPLGQEGGGEFGSGVSGTPTGGELPGACCLEITITGESNLRG